MSEVQAELTPLQSRVAREIVAYARRENLRAGEHLAESMLAEQIGTSRSPVNVALKHLARQGVLQHDLNRGYFLSRDALELDGMAQQFSVEPDDPLYLRIAEDRLAKRLPDEVSEADLMRQYSTSRSVLRKVLSRIQQEGWVEKLVGHGWHFQSLIDSPQAYEESYVFRAAVEPTGLLANTFAAPPAELATLRRQQQFIYDGGYQTMTEIELFESNSHFHESLARWSGNRFIYQSVRRTNQLRRLVEYRQARAREPRKLQAQEHLAILAAIQAQDMLQAASLLRNHIDGARRGKGYGPDIFTRQSDTN
ncbi:GntR family transcriptional regulator [Herbaspirillum sp. NPDC087042]|uniref:GntR family transcriptional regulator n=1 Tax=Herbaspirillum sp. NPDC087042 TaxID=3364004 RepID=UPI00382BA27A